MLLQVHRNAYIFIMDAWIADAQYLMNDLIVIAILQTLD